MLRNKKTLLECARNTAEYIKKNGGGNFAGFIVDIIRYVDRQDRDSEQKVKQLWQILFSVKSSNIEIIEGGSAVKESYIKFIDEYLGIKKSQNEYIPANTDFNDLSLEEIFYVFAWVRRLTKEEKQGKKDKNKVPDGKRTFNGRNERRFDRNNVKADNKKAYYSNEKHSGKRKDYDNAYGNGKGREQSEPFNNTIAEQLRKIYGKTD
ncbi:hypothetical protein Cst_c03220 [Thermoclostridium stercorarium subsp. stercorarium DSM 8532]|jgi:hypothetical protein|uniref:Uncharacterized protein n=3 Tax=Thermoclostridium stercorarium TaxID=1510 RepID=L7VLH4_THES1|nr:hypothetical protein [Thermoclostridium stercorarium]AGC67346.1 hypothetical protein Cst_c03220 [Thermoclostridium stercorarium subsp. stercorarium DSM 8532]AGI38407.1 hypothetical protein Clst_0304 [Thermoclostridium stercorarium subsp. stercorarium DSM 8532]ANW97842.1 hypothetical protein CSTERTH_01715 [Thermoclostridium stercorarium subsp. thermolacticum DSM 2910]ANX00394.1 hypothetical protein CSTERLE_01695 [Thermoclostridium stercorarium subsp. leptospartum DSM 9219]UZQ85938.1 hypothet